VRRTSKNPESKALRRLLESGEPADMFDKTARERVGKVIARAAERHRIPRQTPLTKKKLDAE